MKKKVIEKTELEKRLEAEAEKEQAVADDSPDAGTSNDNVVEEERSELEIERDELKDQLLRARAEFDNYRKRIARDDEARRKMAGKALVTDLLPVVDNLERALEHTNDTSEGLAEGVAMVFKQFCEVLGRHGLEAIPAVGEVFDPNVHEAIMSVDSAEAPEGHVVQELLKGYRMGDYVLRPSKVSVSSGPSGNEENDEEG